MNNKKDNTSLFNKADPTTIKCVLNIQGILMKESLDLIALKNALIELFEYLSSKEGRTDSNCSSVDSFFFTDDLWVERNLPDPFHDIFGDMSGALHDAVTAPEIAENFDSSPEQLLKRARAL